MSQNCKIKSRFNCKLVPAVPVQIYEHYLEDGSLLMRRLVYSVGHRNTHESVSISEELKKLYLQQYKFRENHIIGARYYWIHSKK